MKRVFTKFGVSACGLATSVMTAIAVVVISNLTGFNIFTFSIWVIVPAGAMGVGMAAASGYYLGGLYFHQRATVGLLIQMVVIAASTQLLIYYLGYTTLVLDNGVRVADHIDFGKYLDIILTKTHYRIGRGAHDAGEAGNFGYTMAFLQFIGFSIGGAAVYFHLQGKRLCQVCSLYLRPLSKKEKVFADSTAAAPYYDTLFQSEIGSPEFAEKIRSEVKDKAAKGAVRIQTTLLGCPGCKKQVIDENVSVYNGSDWKDAKDINRAVAVPEGVDLVPVFRGK